MFDDISTHEKLQNAVSVLVEWRLDSTMIDAWGCFWAAQYVIHTLQYRDIRTNLHLRTELSVMDDGLCVYFTAVTFLQVAFEANRYPLTDEMLDILSTVCLQSNDVRRCVNARHSS